MPSAAPAVTAVVAVRKVRRVIMISPLVIELRDSTDAVRCGLQVTAISFSPSMAAVKRGKQPGQTHLCNLPVSGDKLPVLPERKSFHFELGAPARRTPRHMVFHFVQ